MSWDRASSFETTLPPSIRAFEGHNDELPLKAYLVRVDLSDGALRLDAVAGAGGDGLLIPTEVARSTGACVLINGGYYWLDRNDRGRNIGLLVSGGREIEPPMNGLVWQRVRYPVARATIGALDGALPEILWVGGTDRRHIAWSHPLDNALGRPALAPDTSSGRPWPAAWALSAGPVVVMNGAARAYRDEEGFFDNNFARLHPRSAVGITGDGELLLLVVDGRQPASRGAYLEELGVILRDLGAVSAMNLDGGGSSALVVAGRLFNRPSGSNVEREVVSALAVHCPAPIP